MKANGAVGLLDNAWAHPPDVLGRKEEKPRDERLDADAVLVAVLNSGILRL